MVASLVVDHGLQGSVVWSTGSVSLACGIFLDGGSNPCPLHWQVDSLLAGPPGKSLYTFILFF